MKQFVQIVESCLECPNFDAEFIKNNQQISPGCLQLDRILKTEEIHKQNCPEDCPLKDC